MNWEVLEKVENDVSLCCFMKVMLRCAEDLGLPVALKIGAERGLSKKYICIIIMCIQNCFNNFDGVAVNPKIRSAGDGVVVSLSTDCTCCI